MNPFRPAALLLALAVLAGCSKPYVITIDSSPTETRGASVFINGERQGVTPYIARIRFPRKDSRVFIQVVKPNYKPTFEILREVTFPDNERRVYKLEDE